MLNKEQVETIVQDIQHSNSEHVLCAVLLFPLHIISWPQGVPFQCLQVLPSNKECFNKSVTETRANNILQAAAAVAAINT